MVTVMHKSLPPLKKFGAEKGIQPTKLLQKTMACKL
jgi:hypothetical protein